MTDLLVVSGKQLDIEFIYKNIGLGLIPIKDNTAGLNVNAITDIVRDGSDWIIHISGGRSHRMTERDMIQLQETIKTRDAGAHDSMVETYMSQYRAQAEAQIKFQQGIQAVQGTLVDPGGSPPAKWGGKKNNRR